MKAFAVGCVYAEHFWFLIVGWAVGAALFLLPFLFFVIEMLRRKSILRMLKMKMNTNRKRSKMDDKTIDKFNW
jgi:hypothetical protein